MIIARAGSKGLPDKCMRDLRGRPVIAYTFDHALASRALSAIVLTTDSEPAKREAIQAGVEVIDRPAELASDTATVDAAARHAVETWESRHRQRVDAVVLLYGNIPVRAEGLIDRAVEKLRCTGASSVRSVAPVTKQHPDWIHRLDGDRMVQFRPNSIYRRQDLEPLYYHDGAVAVVTRDALFGALKTPDDHQSFLGADRRAIVQRSDEAVDIDELIDLRFAEAVLAARAQEPSPTPTRSSEPRISNSRTLRDSVEADDATRSCVAPVVSIASRRVGPGHRTFVIAEAGVNHLGSVETALRMVDAAAAAGADAVKFQMFNADDLVSRQAATARYQRTSRSQTSQHDLLAPLQLSFEDFHRISRHCVRRSILFMATPFGVPEVAQLQRLGVPAIKIASTDLTTEPLLEAACATGLPLLVSTGAATAEEIDEAVTFVRKCGAGDRLVLLHCVSCYPTPIEAANLGVVATLREAYRVPTGYSDHTTSTSIGALAVAAGACAIEKHFTLDPTADGPDHAVSLSAEQLAEYVAHVREAEGALGSGMPGMSELQADVRIVARKSIVSLADIAAGQVIAAEHLALKRPGTGLPPNELTRVIGRRARVNIPRDVPLTWDMTTP